MQFCQHCGTPLPRKKQGPITVASDAQLRNPIYLADLRRACAAVRMPRRQWRDAIADAVRDFAGELRLPGGHTYAVPLVDDHFPEDDDQRWASAFSQPPPPGALPRLQERMLERVRLVDLYFRIVMPQMAATFGRLQPANDNAEGNNAA